METGEYIANKSKELLRTQVESFRAIHQKAGTVIAVAALFAPVFLFLVEKAELWVRITASLLMIPLLVGIVLQLITLRAKKLRQGYDESNFEELLNKDIETVYNFEISYNKFSIEQNDKILISQNRSYNAGIILTIISVILSIGLIITDTTIKNNSKTDSTMSQENNNSGGEAQKPNVKLITVDPTKVKILNEGVDQKTETRKP